MLNFIIDGNLSFNVVQLHSLKDLLETVGGRKIVIPTRHKLMTTLDSEYNKVKNALRKKLSEQKHLCLTADVWSSRAQSYLGVTVHFLNDKFERESYLLAFKQLFTKQTYKNLADAMDEILRDFGIKKSQVTNIVTDGGSNFCKMFKIYGQQIDAVVTTYSEEENIDEVGDDAENLIQNADADNVVNYYMTDFYGESFVNEVLEFDVVDSNNATNTISSIDQNDAVARYLGQSSPNQNIPINLPPQRRCVSHLLNLLSQDFEKKFLIGLAKTIWIQTFERLHTLWILTRTSCRAKTICKTILGKVLKSPCETRWNSRFDVVKMCSLPEIRNNLNTLIQKLKSELSCASAQNLQTLSSIDFLVIDQYVKVLEPVAIALDSMQKELNGSQGYIMPVLISMRHRISRIEEDSDIGRDFKKAMLSAINKRFENYFVFGDSNRDLLLAALTLPRVRTNFIAEDEDIIYAKNLLISECKKLMSENEQSNTSPQEPEVEMNDDFLISYASSRDLRRNSIENEIESEVSRFLCDVRVDISMLNEFPTIRAAFFKYNTTLSSSAPVERVFSQSLMIFTPRRNRLSSVHFEMAIVMKHNRRIIN